MCRQSRLPNSLRVKQSAVPFNSEGTGAWAIPICVNAPSGGSGSKTGNGGFAGIARKAGTCFRLVRHLCGRREVPPGVAGKSARIRQ